MQDNLYATNGVQLMVSGFQDVKMKQIIRAPLANKKFTGTARWNGRLAVIFREHQYRFMRKI
jgi:hypothetical protein